MKNGDSANNNDNKILTNGNEVTPTPPINGHARFIRSYNRRSLTDSLPNPNSPTDANDNGPRTVNYSDTVQMRRKEKKRVEDDQDEDINTSRKSARPPSSIASSSAVPPPIKPRKSSTTPTGSFGQLSKLQKSHHRHHYQNHDGITSVNSEDDDDDPNSLEGHGGHSDLEDNQSSRHERPNSRLSIRHIDDQYSPTATVNLRRPHHKTSKHANRHSMYDDYRVLDEQQRQPTSPLRSKHSNRSATVRDFPNPSTNRVGSGSGNQSATVRLKSSSKSSSSDLTPTLDLTVAGQKVFPVKQQLDFHMANSMPLPTTARPPSGRLKPISSAKSSSSFIDDLSTTSSKTLEDVTNNSKQLSPTPTRTHLYKKKLAPLNINNELLNKKNSYRSTIESPSYIVDDGQSDRSEETSSNNNVAEENGHGNGAGSGRDYRSANGSEKRSKYH